MIMRRGLDGPLLDHGEGLALQRRLHDDVVRGRLPSALVLCQHAPVYTAGTRTRPGDLPTDGSPVVRVDRGGRITWHGPGQLVAYPVVRLPEPVDVVAHLRRLEDALVATAASVGVTARRVPGRSGAWVDGAGGPEKVGAVGVRVAQGVTTHGLALNCRTPDEPWRAIVPCGIADAGVTDLTRASGRRVDVGDVADALEAALVALVDPSLAGSATATATVPA